MSLYGEPDLTELLPAYYCTYMSRNRPRSNICKGICTHLFAMFFAIGLCLGGYYYYQNVYIPHNESYRQQDMKEDTTKVNFEGWEPQSTGSFLEDISEQVNFMKKQIEKVQSWRSSINTLMTKMQLDQNVKMSNLIEDALETYEADGIGLMDYAAFYAGGCIAKISEETKPYPTHRPLSLLNIVQVDVLSSPEEMLKPCTLPGSCFAFRGRQGKIRIKLAKPLQIGAVTLGHASRMLLGIEGMTSAPKEFEIHAFADDSDIQGTFLGKFTYNSMGKQHQIFPIEKNLTKNQAFEFIELSILNNYGRDEFTCVYRFRVHQSDSIDSVDRSTQTVTKKKCC